MVHSAVFYLYDSIPDISRHYRTSSPAPQSQMTQKMRPKIALALINATDDGSPTTFAADLFSLLMDDGAPLSAAQVRLKVGLADRSLDMANCSLLAGFESRNVYHQTFVLPNKVHPISFQYAPALSTDASASPNFGPLLGQPVSVIHWKFSESAITPLREDYSENFHTTGLSPAADRVSLYM